MSTELLRQRVPSLTESTCSFSSESDEEVQLERLERKRSSISDVANSTFLKKRLSRQSSLPWGHKRSTMIGVSCFLFLLPIPLLIKSCCPFVSSFSSDYLYTGLESWSHTLDRAFAPIALVSLQHFLCARYCLAYLGAAIHSLSIPPLVPLCQGFKHIRCILSLRNQMGVTGRILCYLSCLSHVSHQTQQL
jgi:hypothetical protein